MVTVKALLQALAGLPHQLANHSIYVVTEMNIIERGQFEGGVALTTAPVAGVALGPHGLILFVDKKEDNQLEQIMVMFPPGLKSGDEEIDRHIREQFGSSGEEWKNG